MLGTRDSPEALARMEYAWYAENESHTAGEFAGRAVLPYLLVGNVRGAHAALEVFTSALCRDNGSLAAEDVRGRCGEVRVFPSIPLLNFLSLLLLAVQRGSAELYKQLITKYSAHLKEGGAWFDALDAVAEMYFGVKRPRQANPLFDMMGSLFGGGGGGGGGGGAQRRPARVEAPVAEGLD